MTSCCVILCEILLAILLPPLGVCLRHGCCSVEFFICLVLTILGYVPGIIYALYSIACLDPDRLRGDYYALAWFIHFLVFMPINFHFISFCIVVVLYCIVLLCKLILELFSPILIGGLIDSEILYYDILSVWQITSLYVIPDMNL